jgi:hypothetical protein
MVKEATRRNVEIKEITFDPKKSPPSGFSEEDICIALSVRYKWYSKFVPFLKSLGIKKVIMLSSGANTELPGTSSVTVSYDTAMASIAGIFKEKEKKKAALFCVNSSYTTDDDKIAAFRNNFGVSTKDIYTHESTLADMSEKLYEQKDRYDSLICANPISFITMTNCFLRHGEDIHDKFYTAVFGDVIPNNLYMNCDVLAQIRGDDAGKCAVSAAAFLQKNSEAMSVSVTVSCDAKVLDTVEFALESNSARSTSARIGLSDVNELNEDKYADENTVVIENVLCNCDSLDMSIIYAILNDEIYSEMAERLHISENTITYRIKRMLKLYPGKSKRELLNELKQYI